MSEMGDAQPSVIRTIRELKFLSHKESWPIRSYVLEAIVLGMHKERNYTRELAYNLHHAVCRLSVCLDTGLRHPCSAEELLLPYDALRTEDRSGRNRMKELLASLRG